MSRSRVVEAANDDVAERVRQADVSDSSDQRMPARSSASYDRSVVRREGRGCRARRTFRAAPGSPRAAARCDRCRRRARSRNRRRAAARPARSAASAAQASASSRSSVIPPAWKSDANATRRTVGGRCVGGSRPDSAMISTCEFDPGVRSECDSRAAQFPGRSSDSKNALDRPPVFRVAARGSFGCCGQRGVGHSSGCRSVFPASVSARRRPAFFRADRPCP